MTAEHRIVPANAVGKTVGGETFEDRFAHLHEDTPESLSWQWERDRLAQHAAESSANYASVRDRLLQLGECESAILTVACKRGALWFDLVEEGDDKLLRASEAPNGPGRTVVSKRSIAQAIGGGEVELFQFSPSPRGRFVAVGWAVDGDIIGRWSVYETDTGRYLLDASGFVLTGGPPAWLPDESGFWLADRNAAGDHRLHFVPMDGRDAERREVLLGEQLVPPQHSGLTVQLSPDGRRGVAVTEPHEHTAVIRWSPYHNIADGVIYPAVYQVFGELDPSSMPFHGRKFTARLEEASASDRPIHLRVWRNTAHDPVGRTMNAAYQAEWLAFLMDQIGLARRDLAHGIGLLLQAIDINRHE